MHHNNGGALPRTQGLGGRSPYKEITYAALIALAIYQMPGRRAKMSDIYKYIEDYVIEVGQELPDRYKFSIRHNLSTRPCFVRLIESIKPRNSWWTVSESKLPVAARNSIRQLRRCQETRTTTSQQPELRSDNYNDEEHDNYDTSRRP